MDLFAYFWPVAMLALGVYLYLLAFQNVERRWGLLMPATILTLLSLVFMYSILFGWESWTYLWPMPILSVGVGFILMWLLGRIAGLVFPAVLFTTLGLVFLLITSLSVLFDLSFAALWPLILIVVGIIVIMSYYSRGGTWAEKGAKRHLESSIPLSGATRARLTVNFGAGELGFSDGAREGDFLNGEFYYVVGGLEPHVEKELRGDVLECKLGIAGGFPALWGIGSKNRWSLRLNESIPTELSLRLGAFNGSLNLGGLSLSSLEIKSGAAEASFSFDKDNRISMGCLKVNTGVSDFKFYGLSRANFERMVLNGGLGSYLLDFSGQLSRSAQVEVKCGLSEVKVEIPGQTSAVIETPENFFSSLDIAGFVRVGNEYRSQSFGNSKPTLRIVLKSGLGSLSVKTI